MLTIKKVADLLKDLRTKTENGEIQWSPFMKQKKEKEIVGFYTSLKNGTIFKISHILGDKKSLTLKVRVYKTSDDALECYMSPTTVRLASMESTPSLNNELLDLETAVILANRKIPEWAEQALFVEN